MKNIKFYTLCLAVPMILAGAIIFAFPWYGKPLLEAGISRSLPGYRVRIASVSGSLLHDIKLKNVDLRDSDSHFAVKKAVLRFQIPDLLNKRITSLLLENGRVELDQPDEAMPKLSFASKNASGQPGVVIERLDLENLEIKIHTRDLSVNGTLSFSRDMLSQQFVHLDMQLDSLKAGPIQWRSVDVRLDPASLGSLTIASMEYEKFKIKDLSGHFSLTDKDLELTLDSAGFLDTQLRGKAAVTFFPTLRYQLDIKLDPLPITALIQLYEWDKKVSLSGPFAGSLTLSGEGSSVKTLSGVWQSTSDGNVVILDEAFLQKIANSAKQPIEIIKASFEKYHYNKGRLTLSLDERALRLGMDLEGEAGKRNLEVYLHDLL